MAVAKSRVMDVASPGKSKPDATSRPIIVTHGAIMKDPMMQAATVQTAKTVNDETGTADSQTSAQTSHAERVVRPPEPSAPAEAPEKPADEPVTMPDEPTSDEGNESAIIDAIAEQAGSKKKTKDQDSEQKARNEALDKLIQEKKYFVPIGQVRKHHNRNAGILILVLIVIFVAGILAIDAEVLNLGLKLPFDII